MDIKLEETTTKGAFFIEDHTGRIAQMTFSKAGEGRIIIDHTEVSDVLRGKGAGKQLVSAVVDYARKNNVKVLPLCTFTKSVIDKVKEFQDVLDK